MKSFRRMSFAVTGIAALLATLAACGGSGGGSSGSFSIDCNLTSAGACIDKTAPGSSSSVQMNAIQTTCTSNGGTLSTSATCSTADRVGALGGTFTAE
jgi:hypothetical protein